MEKKTRLITIEYDEYIKLRKIRDNTEKIKIKELKSELENLIDIVNNVSVSTFEKKDIEGMIKAIIKACDYKLQQLEEEVENDEN